MLVVKDEARYLEEWLTFHRAVGIEHIYVYDNGSTDETWEALEPFVADGFVTRETLSTPHLLTPIAPGVHLQQLAVWHALANHGGGWRWMTFLDVDEFLFPASGDDLRVTLEDYSDLPGLVTFWSMFGFSGHDAPPAGGVVANYTRRGVFPIGTNTKVIVDPRNVSTIRSIHRIGDRLFDEQRRPFDDVDLKPVRGLDGNPPPSGPYLPTNDVFRLHHYYTRSRSEFDAKYRRLMESGNVTSTKMRLLAELIERETVEDRSALRFLSDGGASVEG